MERMIIAYTFEGHKGLFNLGWSDINSDPSYIELTIEMYRVTGNPIQVLKDWRLTSDLQVTELVLQMYRFILHELCCCKIKQIEFMGVPMFQIVDEYPLTQLLEWLESAILSYIRVRDCNIMQATIDSIEARIKAKEFDLEESKKRIQFLNGAICDLRNKCIQTTHRMNILKKSVSDAELQMLVSVGDENCK